MPRQSALGTLTVPDDWDDQTTVQFVSPPRTVAKAPLAAGHGVEGYRASVVLARTALPADVAAVRASLTDLVEQLRASVDAFELVSREDWEHPEYGATPAIVYRFEAAPGVFLQQAVAYCLPTSAETAIGITMTWSPAAAADEGEMREVLASYLYSPAATK